MTTRKPPRLSFPSFVEQQIREAERSGAFENLPGKGKPIPGLGKQRHELAWMVEKLRAENVDVAAALPPALALAREVELLPDRVRAQPSEALVRELVTELNARIRRAHLAPQEGPPVRVRSVDVEAMVEHWRATRTPVVAQPTPPPRASRRRWCRRR